MKAEPCFVPPQNALASSHIMLVFFGNLKACYFIGGVGEGLREPQSQGFVGGLLANANAIHAALD